MGLGENVLAYLGNQIVLVLYLTDNRNSRHFCWHVSSLSQYSLFIIYLQNRRILTYLVIRMLIALWCGGNCRNLTNQMWALSRVSGYQRLQRWLTPRRAVCSKQTPRTEGPALMAWEISWLTSPFHRSYELWQHMNRAASSINNY